MGKSEKHPIKVRLGPKEHQLALALAESLDVPLAALLRMWVVARLRQIEKVESDMEATVKACEYTRIAG